MKPVDQLKVRLFADGADKKGMLEMYRLPYVKGFTTNPTLMRKVGIADYEAFAKDILAAIPDRSISFEVFADDSSEMERQARRIAPWGKHVSVKIPIMNTKKESTIPLVRKLSRTWSMRSRAGRRASSRCSPAASPTPAAIRCR